MNIDQHWFRDRQEVLEHPGPQDLPAPLPAPGTRHPPGDGGQVASLSPQECLALLRTASIGRIVFTDRALPAIQPVNFALDGEDIIIRTRPGTKLAAATRRAVVAFEADDLDPETGAGWTVTLVGQAEAVRDPGQVVRLLRLPLYPWSPEPLHHFIRIRTHRITGRRVRKNATP